MADEQTATDTGRRAAVLESAMLTFARNGFRGTSMDSVARAARISRPGLYFLFSAKEHLFREAASHVVAQDLTAIERELDDPQRPLVDRVVAAFDRWAGRYVGPMALDVARLLQDNPDLIDESTAAAPERFHALLVTAIAAGQNRPHATDIASTLESVSVGLKHQVDLRQDYVTRMRTAAELLLATR